MKQKTIRFFLTALVSFLLLSFAFVPSRVRSEEGYGLAIQLDESNGNLSDYITFTLDNYVTKYDHLGFKLNPSYAVDQNGSKPMWSMFQMAVTDTEGNKYYTRQTNGETVDSGKYMPSFDESGNYIKTTYGYSYIWPKIGFYGTVYIPYSEMTTTDGKVLEKNTTLTSLSITHNSKSNARQQMLTFLFEMVDANVVIGAQAGSSWIGDVKILNDFNATSSANRVTEKTQVLDFTKLDPESETISLSENAKMYARRMTKAEYDEVLTLIKDNTTVWKAGFSTSGQPFDYYPIENGNYNEALCWKYGIYYEMYDSKLNSYGSLSVPVSDSNWKDALGLTIYVKNYQPYPCSFNLEFAEQEDGGSERWNLNSDFYRTIYAYDVNTGEEYAFHSLTVCELPANFEGWLRIPFSEYECPSWSLANAWTDGILDLNRKHTNIYITSQFVKNDSVMMMFDNVGLFYQDFEVGKLFDRSKPSIKDCLEMDYNGGN